MYVLVKVRFLIEPIAHIVFDSGGRMPETEYGKEQGFVKASIRLSHLFGKAMPMEDECKSRVGNELFLFNALGSREASFKRLPYIFVKTRQQ